MPRGGAGVPGGLLGGPRAEPGKQPVFFNEDAQDLLVGDDGVSIQAEVEFTLGVLPTLVPVTDQQTEELKLKQVGEEGTAEGVKLPLTLGPL